MDEKGGGISYKVLDPDTKTKMSQRVTKCHYAIVCVLGTLCVAAFAFTVYHIFENQGFVGSTKTVHTRIHLLPPFSQPVESMSGTQKPSWPDPPPHDQVAMVARYIVHTSDWASIATYSVSPMIEGSPFANILSLSDGPVEISSGVPYMYLTPMDLTSHDLEQDSRASLSMTEAQSDYCRNHNYDPMSPLCARVLLTGSIVKVEKDSDEEAFARNAVFTRHPEMKDWPVAHNWYFAKMNITHIYVLDYFGGASDISVEEYFKSNPFKNTT